MKKLIPALCMLLVAACLMGTSTYAWFSANMQVTASGMQVKAASNGGLAIASYTTSDTTANTAAAPGLNDFKSSATAEWTNKTGDVQPTSVDDGKWWKATATSVDSYAATAYTETTDTTGFYQQTKWQIKSLAETGTVNVTLSSITVSYPDGETETSANLNKALRVALKVTNGSSVEWFYFAPNRTAPGEGQPGYTYIAEAGAPATYGATGNNELNYTTTPNKQIATGVGNTPIDVEAYVYYEGQDENCKSANALNINTLKVTLVYSAS